MGTTTARFVMSVTPGKLDRLIKAHWTEVYGTLMAITGNSAMSEDLTQETFLLALKKGLRPGPEIRWWLREAARRLAANELRRKRLVSLDALGFETADTGGGTDDITREPDFNDRLEALRQCLAELPEADREMLNRKYEGGANLASIAADNRQSVGYSKQRLFRLRKRLGKCIRKRLGIRQA